MEYKPKFMHATVTLTLPAVEADAAVWDSYDPKIMVENFKKQLENNLIEMIEGPFDEETLGITAEIELKDTAEA